MTHGQETRWAYSTTTPGPTRVHCGSAVTLSALYSTTTMSLPVNFLILHKDMEQRIKSQQSSTFGVNNNIKQNAYITKTMTSLTSYYAPAAEYADWLQQIYFMNISG